MINNLKREACKALGALTKHKAIAELKAQQQTAFEVLDPQIRIAKSSPTVQIATASVISGLLLTGNFGTAVAVTSAWLGSRPLTHLAAGCVAGVGAVDAALVNAFGRLDAMQADPAADEEPAKARRRRAKARVAVGG